MSRRLAEARGDRGLCRIGKGVAVVAETSRTERGLRALTVEWDCTSGPERRSSEELLAEHVRRVERAQQRVVARDDGEA